MDKFKKYIAITFDDGPQETNDKLLDILQEKNAKVTFFMLGEKMQKRPEIVKRAISEGHEIGWHSFDHSINGFDTKERIDKDLDLARSIMNDIAPSYEYRLFRAPGGQFSAALLHSAKEHGMKFINWSNYSFIDDQFKDIPAKERADNVFTAYYGVRDGEIILVHPRDRDDIIEGIGILIDRLRNDGFETVTVSKLLEIKDNGIPIYNFII